MCIPLKKVVTLDTAPQNRYAVIRCATVYNDTPHYDGIYFSK